MQACQTATIQLVHVPGHAGIWQNELADRYAKETLRDITVAKVNNDIAQATEFAKSFYSRAPTYAKIPSTHHNISADQNFPQPSLGCSLELHIQDDLGLWIYDGPSC